MFDSSEVVAYWRAAGYEKWFARDDAFDAELRRRFSEAHFAASTCSLEHWVDDAQGALALLILLDQFPRNAYRKSAHAYATDPLARHYAERAIAAGFDLAVAPELRVFFYLPFEHSEEMADQERSIAWCAALGDANYLDYAKKHRDVIARFGRFPHRNRELGRITTPDEKTWLDAGGGFA